MAIGTTPSIHAGNLLSDQLISDQVLAAFLILENRSPQSTFAWLFLLLVFSLGGLLIYVMFGRKRHAFSRERTRTLTKLLEGTSLADRASRVVAEQPAKLAALSDQYPDQLRDEPGDLR